MPPTHRLHSENALDAPHPAAASSLCPSPRRAVQQHTTAVPPDVYRDVPLPRLLAAFDTAPARLRAAVAGLTEEQLRARPRPGKWSVLEIALHVTDADIVGASRFRHALAQPGITVVGYDQDAWADALGYNDTPLAALAESLDLFASIRRNSAALFRRAAADRAWDRVVHHPERGALTLRNLLELYADHGDRHIAQILANRELLGVPPSPRVELVLPERLY